MKTSGADNHIKSAALDMAKSGGAVEHSTVPDTPANPERLIALCDCGHDQSPPGLARWINGLLYCEMCADDYDTVNDEDSRWYLDTSEGDDDAF